MSSATCFNFDLSKILLSGSGLKQQQPSIGNHMHCFCFMFSDCPVFRIAYLKGYDGTCPIIGRDEGSVTMEYCLDKCLDMPGCRGITISAANSGQCTYHTCIDKETSNSTSQFVWRVCINDTIKDALGIIPLFFISF